MVVSQAYRGRTAAPMTLFPRARATLWRRPNTVDEGVEGRTTVPDRPWLMDRLRPLVGLQAAGNASRDETFVAWTRALELLVADRGPVIVIEDVHWADEELLQFLVSDALTAATVPIVLVLTGRPEVLEQEAVARLMDETIALAPLEGNALDDLLASAAPDLNLRPAERAEIIRRAGGNPLFTLELVRLRSQQRAVGGGDGDALPETVQAVIAARLDLLSLGARSVARDAAVVGAAFWPGALQATTPRGPELDTALAELSRLDIIRRRNVSTLAGEPEFAFRHALVRDVAYGQLTRGDRASRHALVGHWLAEVAPDRLDLSGVIADHDVRALDLFAAAAVEPPSGLAAHAFDHLVRAGSHAEAVDPATAVERYRQAASVAPNPTDHLRALIGLIRGRDELGAHAAELETIEVARALATSLDDRRTLGLLKVYDSLAHRPLGDARWVADAKEAVEILEGIPPSPELVEALVQRSLVELATFEGTRGGVQLYASRAIELADALAVPAPAMAYSRRGFSRAGDGDERAIDDVARARALAEAGGSGSTLVRIISDQGGVLVYFGQVGPAEQLLREAISIARRRGLGVTDHLETNLVYAHRVLGRWDEAVALAEPSLLQPWPEERQFTFAVRANELMFIRADRGDATGVRTLLERLPEGPEAHGGGDDMLRSMGLINLGYVLGDADLIERGVAGVPTRDDDLDFDGRMTTEYPTIARAAVSIGRPDLLDRFVRSIAATAPLACTTRELLVGYRAAGAGEHEEAVEALRAAGDQLAAWGFLPEATHAQQHLLESELAIGRKADAMARVEPIRATWMALGAALPAARLDRILEAHQARVRHT